MLCTCETETKSVTMMCQDGIMHSVKKICSVLTRARVDKRDVITTITGGLHHVTICTQPPGTALGHTAFRVVLFICGCEQKSSNCSRLQSLLMTC